MKPGDKIHETDAKLEIGGLVDGEYTVDRVEGNFVYLREHPGAGWRKNRFEHPQSGW